MATWLGKPLEEKDDMSFFESIDPSTEEILIRGKLAKSTILFINKIDGEQLMLTPPQLDCIASIMYGIGWRIEDITNLARTLELIFSDDEYEVIVIR